MKYTYAGSNSRMSASDYTALAAQFDVPEAALRAVIDTETSGRGFNSMGKIEYLFEPHIFYRQLSGTQRQTAINQGLAYKNWKGPGSYPKTLQLRWAQYQKACAINEDAAAKSASWGLGQIMGSEYGEAGFGSLGEMLSAFAESEENQVEGMLRLCVKRGIDKAMRKFPDITACRQFAKSYNGAGYERNAYHTKLAQRTRYWQQKLGTSTPTDPKIPAGAVKFGDRGPQVRVVQDLLVEKGYQLNPDDKFGTETRGKVLQWKADVGRKADPWMTLDDIEALKNSPDKEIPEERAEKSKADVVADNDSAKDMNTAKNVGAGSVIAGSAASLLDDPSSSTSDALNTAQDTVDKVHQAKGIWDSIREFLNTSIFGDVIHFIAAHRFWFIVGGTIIATVLVNRALNKKVEAVRTGKDLN